MVSILILATVLALSGVVSVGMAWAVLGSLLYMMQTRAARRRAVTATVDVRSK
jgi:hypothetical protein